jgi:chromate transport protein ChrA
MSPHTAWGVEHEQVRPAVANLIAGLEAAGGVLLLTAGFAVYRNKANRSTWQGELFAYLLVSFLVIAVLRVSYILFYLT